MSYASVVLADSPVGYWRLNEAAGSTTVLDASGNANTGTVNGGVTFRQHVANGALGTGALFDGSTGYISIPAIAVAANPVTLEAWVFITAYPGALRAIVDRSNAFGMWINSTNKVNLGNEGGGNFDSLTSPSLNVWHHVVGVINGASSAIYLDGVSDQTGTVNVVSQNNALAIGAATGGGTYLTCTLSNVAIYTAALTSTRIAAHYNAGLAGLLFGGFGPLGA